MSQPDRELVLAPHHSDPPRHQPREPLRLPPRLATTQDPRDLAVGLALQCRDVEVLDTVEVVAPGPPALDVAEWPSLGCVHGALPPSERESLPQRLRAARRRRQDFHRGPQEWAMKSGITWRRTFRSVRRGPHVLSSERLFNVGAWKPAGPSTVILVTGRGRRGDHFQRPVGLVRY